MIETLLFDFAGVLLFTRSSANRSELGRMYAKLSEQDSIWNRYELNEVLLEFLKKKRRDYTLAILTNSYHLPTHPEIRPKLDEVFAEVFLARNLKYNKDQPACYLEVLKKLQAQPETALFIDDTHRNISAAEEAGLHTIQYQHNEQLFSDLKKHNIS